MRIVPFAATILVAVSTFAAPSVAQDARGRYLAQCRADTLAQYPEAAAWVDDNCAEGWTAVVRSNPLVDILLSPFAADAPAPASAAELQRRATLVRWSGSGAQGLTGRFGEVDVQIPADSPLRLVVGWGATGQPIPYDVVGALKTRGATVELIGCYDYGASESNSVYRVAAPDRAPFALTVYRREAPTASAESFLTLTVAPDRAIPTLAALRRADPDSEWKTQCA